MNTIYAICISSPICLLIIVFGLPRIMRGKGNASVDVGNVKVSVGEGEQEAPRRRAMDSDEYVQDLAVRIAGVIKETTHECRQAPLLESLTEAVEILTPTVAGLAAEAVTRNINGVVKKGAEALPGFEQRFRAMGRKKIVQEGVAS
jgi:hypothetical protein